MVTPLLASREGTWHGTGRTRSADGAWSAWRAAYTCDLTSPTSLICTIRTDGAETRVLTEVYRGDAVEVTVTGRHGRMIETRTGRIEHLTYVSPRDWTLVRSSIALRDGADFEVRHVAVMDKGQIRLRTRTRPAGSDQAFRDHVTGGLNAEP
ncbi:MAG: hypothetical protein ACFB6R_12460 [Alphaproteobacteria bacterium]